MRRAVLSAVVAAFAAAALLVSGIAAAAVSPVYNVTGLELGATSTQGSFVGTGSGSNGDRLIWRASVEHTALSTNPATPAAITGGTLTATSAAGGGGTTALGGTFTGGTVTYDAARSSGGTCGNEVYDVSGDLVFDGWAGTFTVLLTHYRIRVLNRCLTLMASVTGTLTSSASSSAPPSTTPPPGEF